MFFDILNGTAGDELTKLTVQTAGPQPVTEPWFEDAVPGLRRPPLMLHRLIVHAVLGPVKRPELTMLDHHLNPMNLEKSSELV